MVRGQDALVVEDLGQRLGLVEHPGVHGGDEGIAADKVHLEGEDAEEEVAVCGRTGRSLIGQGRRPPGGQVMVVNDAWRAQVHVGVETRNRLSRSVRPRGVPTTANLWG